MSCYTPYTAQARPSYNKCSKEIVAPKIPKNALKICGTLNKTNVFDCEQHIATVLHTFYITVQNSLGVPLYDTWLDIDVRVVACNPSSSCGSGGCGDDSWCGDGCGGCNTNTCFNPQEVQVIGAKECYESCCCSDSENGVLDKKVDPCGTIHARIPKLNPGIAIFTVIVPLQNPEHLCPPPCSLLPSLFTLKIVKCFCENEIKVLYQTSTIVGCQPAKICCANGSCGGVIPQ